MTARVTPKAKPVKSGGKPTPQPKGGKLNAAGQASLKAKLKGKGLQQAEVDTIVTSDATAEEMVAEIIAVQRGYPKAEPAP